MLCRIQRGRILALRMHTMKIKTAMVPEISIIIPNYNGVCFLSDALRSVMAQTLKNWECIIIDDGSTDDSVSVIKEFVDKDKRFKLIQLVHGGVSVARNAGLDAARGRYIAFLDSDDCYTDYALEMMLYFATTTGADMVGGGAFVVPHDFNFIPVQTPSWNQSSFRLSDSPNDFLLLPQTMNWCWIWRRIYKRELFDSVRFQPEFTGMGDDLSLMIDICWRARTIVETTNTTVFHRHHTGQMTEQKFNKKSFDFFPHYLKYIQEIMLIRYDTTFLRRFYHATMPYLLRETLIVPSRLGVLQSEALQVLKESLRYIPRHYLYWRYRLLFWLLKWVK